MENDNKTIHEWAFPDECWHDGILEADSGGYRCLTCRLWSMDYTRLQHPDYTEAESMLRLIDAVRGKGWGVEICDDGPHCWTCRIYSHPMDEDFGRGHESTLPATICAAVLKLIESEAKNEQTG